MKKESYAVMSNRCFKAFKLTDGQIDQLHRVLLIVMDDIDAICRKHGIPYMLSGGSCLGAIRHQGFIPWDDDIDIMLYYADMVRLGKAIESEMGDKYTVMWPLSKVGDGRMMKIFLNGTSYVEVGKESMPLPNKVFVDVFPIISMPSSAGKRKLNGKIHRLSARMYAYGLFSKFPSEVMKSLAREDKSLRKYYGRRRRLGGLARFFGLKMWQRKLTKLERDSKKPTAFEGIPSGIDYDREVFERGFFSETVDADFEGRRYSIPKRYDEYLKNLYRDYMQIPPPEKREQHYASVVDFGEYVTKEGRGENR